MKKNFQAWLSNRHRNWKKRKDRLLFKFIHFAVQILSLLSERRHHIKDRPAYLRTLRRYLKPAGRIAVIDPIDRWPPFHGRMKYTLDELDGWMQGARYMLCDISRKKKN